MTETEKKIDKKIKPKKNIKKIILLLISYVVVAAIVWKIAIRVQSDPIKQQEQAQKEIQSIIHKVGELIVLPANETPEIALIQDVNTLKKTQDFFVDAMDGDKVLIYGKTRKAIIYRESEHKIINVTLNVGPSADEADTKSIPKPNPVENVASTTENSPSADSQ